jgi:hypothetical protein
MLFKFMRAEAGKSMLRRPVGTKPILRPQLGKCREQSGPSFQPGNIASNVHPQIKERSQAAIAGCLRDRLEIRRAGDAV